jgi:hypothetical protein
MATTYTFPPDQQSEIPVYLKFRWADYARYNSKRTKTAINSSGNYILVPYPKLFNVSNDMKYMDSGTVGGSLADFAKIQIDNLTKSTDMTANYFMQGGSAFTFDNMETVLAPGGRRKYDISIDLVSKTLAQAQMAVNIANSFQLNAHSTWDGTNVLVWKHPPLWYIQACNNTGGELPGWSPSTLPAVLYHVDINRNPILDTPFNLNGNYPLAININLRFMELEPAVNYGNQLVNRAETFR